MYSDGARRAPPNARAPSAIRRPATLASVVGRVLARDPRRTKITADYQGGYELCAASIGKCERLEIGTRLIRTRLTERYMPADIYSTTPRPQPTTKVASPTSNRMRITRLTLAQTDPGRDRAGKQTSYEETA